MFIFECYELEILMHMNENTYGKGYSVGNQNGLTMME